MLNTQATSTRAGDEDDPSPSATSREVAPSPLVSVVMPVHNGLPYLKESVESVLNQTLSDFEFIILNDGSTDATAAALREFARRDRRMRIFESERRLGLAGSSNYVVRSSRAQLVARMDADDVAHPDRLKRQWEVFEAHTRASLVGTLWEGIDPRGARVRPRDRWRLVRRSTFAPFPHGSIMFRRSAYEQVGGYREECAYWEDLDFYLRMAATGQVLVIPEALYRYRFHLSGSRFIVRLNEVERGIGLMYRCLSERRAGRDYQRLLREPEEAFPADEKLPPAVFTSIGSARLWAGHSPAALESLLRRGALALDRASAVALVWAAWGALSPASLRLGIRGLTRASDFLASRRLKDRRLHEWRFE